AHGLAGLSERLGYRQHVWQYLAVGALAGEIRKVLRGAEAARHDQRIEILGPGFAQILDFAPCQPRSLGQHVAAFRHLFAGEVVDYMKLRNVRRKALYNRATLIKA